MENNCRGNNKFSSCPQLMSDGRAFTDYRPRCMNDFTMCSYDHRQFLITNADNLMNKDRIKFYNNNKCSPCMEPFNEGTMLNEASLVSCNKNTCSVKSKDVEGLGTGRNYNDNIAPMEAQNTFMKLKMVNSSSVGEECVQPNDDPLYYAYAGEN